MKIEIQINNEAAFVPDEVFQIGNEYGTEEATQPNDKVRHYKLSSRMAIVDYIYQDKHNRNFFRSGKWEAGTNGMPRFVVSEILEFAK
jgi:hypothetical protein